MQFRLVDLFALVALCAALFGLASWLGIELAVIIATVPLCLISERLFVRTTHESDVANSRSIKRRIFITVVCALGTPVVAHISTSTRIQTTLSPRPLLSIFPLYFGFPLRGSAIMIGAFLLYAWPITRSSRGPIPIRATSLLSLASLLSIGWLITTWRDGLGYHGPAHIVAIACINAIVIGTLWWLWACNHRNGSFSFRMTFATLLFYWLFWYAFPWFGPMH